MNPHRLYHKVAVALCSAALAAALSADRAAAQDIALRVAGRVEWIAAQVMVIAPPLATAIHVDLSKVAQDEYQGLTPGDEVLVTGTLAIAGNRIIATSIERLAL